jgi:hypothetical protein
MAPIRMSRSWANSVVFAVVAIPASVAAAPSCQENHVCAELALRALQAGRDQDWPTARALYEQAYRQVPEPELLVNIGRSWHKLGQCDRAKELYRQYHTQVPQPPPDLVAVLARFEHEANTACQESPNGQAQAPARPVQPAEQVPASGAQRVSANAQTQPAVSAPPDVASGSGGLHKKWWFWMLVGTAAAGTTIGLAVGLAPQQMPKMQPDPYTGITYVLTFEPKN